MGKRAFLAALCCASLGACAPQLSGVRPILDSNGPVAGKDDSNELYNLKNRFFTKAKAASSGQTGGAVQEMMQSGFLLARANCGEFFDDMGVLQRDATIGRDMIAPILTILTGVVATREFSGATSDKYLEIFSLGSTAALAGIDVVDKHFLFDADNIQEVRELTFKALAADQTGVQNLGTANFDTGVAQLINHQVICTPANILQLTRRAIRATEITPNTRAGATADRRVLADLGAALGTPGPITQEQAGALWHLYMSGRTPDKLPQEVAAELADLGPKPLIAADANGKIALSADGTSQAATIIAILQRFSSGTQAAFSSASRSRTDVNLTDEPFAIAPADQTTPVELIID